jgi:glycosyltransferase involved in cell wall biosynthesis
MSRRVALMAVNSHEVHGHSLAARFLGLLDRGWDAHLVCDEDPGWWEEIPELREPEVAGRVHLWGLAQSRWDTEVLEDGAPRSARTRTRKLKRPLRRLWWRRPWSDFRRRTRAIQRRGGLRRWPAGALAILRPDLVHFGSAPSALAGAAVKDLVGCRLVATLGGEDLGAMGLGDDRYYEPLWREADALHLPDASLWRRAEERGCPPHKRRAVIPAATDPEFFVPSPDGQSGRRLRLLSLGPLEWTQGYDHALHAVRLLRDRGIDCEYRILGSGEYVDAVSFARYQLGLEEEVTVLPSAAGEELRGHLAWADVYVGASVVEGTPGALVDAQAMGLPSVLSDAGRDGTSLDGCGFVVPRRDPAALAERLEDLARDPELRARLGEGAREHALRAPLEAQIDAFEDLYLDVLDVGSASARPHRQRPRAAPAANGDGAQGAQAPGGVGHSAGAPRPHAVGERKPKLVGDLPGPQRLPDGHHRVSESEAPQQEPM